MFALFYNLYIAMFTGVWVQNDTSAIISQITRPFNVIGKFLTSIFNNVDTPMEDLGTTLFSNNTNYMLYLVSFVLALITSIGIVVMSVKGVKKAFGIFFMGIRR